MQRAEYQDVRMYARIVVGIQLQCLVSGYVHPLTRKSLQDVFKTKQANEEELEKKLHDHDEEGEDWEIAYMEDGDENSVETPLPCHPMGDVGTGANCGRDSKLWLDNIEFFECSSRELSGGTGLPR